MQFRTFVWPTEPRTLKITQQRKAVSKILEDGHWYVQNTATTGRVFEGEGVFYGTSCHAQFKLLAALLQDGVAGTLKLPDWGEYQALLTELSVTEEDSEDFLTYQFCFVEVP